MSNDRTGERTMSSMEPCPFCGGGFKVAQEPSDNPPVSNLWYLFHEYGPIGSPARDCLISVHKYFDTEAEAITAFNTRAPIPVTDEMVERAAVARCIELIREVQEGFLSPEYATGQPHNSFQERFACGRVIERLEQEYALGTTEQRALLGKPSLTAALGGGNG